MKIKELFRKKEISPYGIEDKVTFRNVDKTLTLYVRGDAASFVMGLKKAQEKLRDMLSRTCAAEATAILSQILRVPSTKSLGICSEKKATMSS